MKKDTRKMVSYTKSKTSLSTVVDKNTMDHIYKSLDNPPKGTPALFKILKEIESERST